MEEWAFVAGQNKANENASASLVLWEEVALTLSCIQALPM